MDLYGVNELFDTYFQSMLHLPGHQYWWLSFLRKKFNPVFRLRLYLNQ